MHNPVFSGAAAERCYDAPGNKALLEMSENCNRVLDLGCGSGANASLLREKFANVEVFGVTLSEQEAVAASQKMERCWVLDLEEHIPPTLSDLRFDTLIFSHVLEHLRDPATVLARLSALLLPGGQVLIAVPNVLFWRERLLFMRGIFEYQPTGALDSTHLRFFTYETADRYLLAGNGSLSLSEKRADGSVPLWWLRRYVLPASICISIDLAGCRYWPNLFGSQVLIRAIKN
jgi:SAM-dependent methyltransferase